VKIYSAKREIDKIFGNGYAAKHPELVIAFMDACVRDYDTASRLVETRAKLETKMLVAENTEIF
jgi:hypothetical protein